MRALKEANEQRATIEASNDEIFTSITQDEAQLESIKEHIRMKEEERLLMDEEIDAVQKKLTLARDLIFQNDALLCEEMFDETGCSGDDDDELFGLPQKDRTRPQLEEGARKRRFRGDCDGDTPPSTPPHTPGTPRSDVVHSTFLEGPIRPRRHVFEAHTTRLPALASSRCTVCGKSISFGSKTVKCTQCHHVHHTACLGRIPPDCRPPPFGSEAAKRRKLPPFGSNLLKSIDGSSASGRVPAVVEECIAAIDRRGLAREGIYGVPVDPAAARQIVDRFYDGGRRPNVMTVADIHLVAAALVTFLTDLDEPLLTLPLHERFLAEVPGPGSLCPAGGPDAEHAPTAEERGARLRTVLLALPPAHFHTAMAVVLHLQR